MNDKPRIQLESLAFPITAHRLGIGKLAHHIMTFNQYIGLTKHISNKPHQEKQKHNRISNRSCRLSAGASRMHRRSL